MGNNTKPAARKRPARSVGWRSRWTHPSGWAAGCLAITEGKRTDLYLVLPLPCEDGKGFELTKLEPGEDTGLVRYCVCLDGFTSSCECKGFLRHSHCRHIESLQALQARELL